MSLPIPMRNMKKEVFGLWSLVFVLSSWFLVLCSWFFVLPAYCSCFPLSAFCFPLTALCLLPTAYCLLPTAFCLLLCAFCLLLYQLFRDDQILRCCDFNVSTAAFNDDDFNARAFHQNTFVRQRWINNVCLVECA